MNCDSNCCVSLSLHHVSKAVATSTTNITFPASAFPKKTPKSSNQCNHSCSSGITVPAACILVISPVMCQVQSQYYHSACCSGSVLSTSFHHHVASVVAIVCNSIRMPASVFLTKIVTPSCAILCSHSCSNCSTAVTIITKIGLCQDSNNPIIFYIKNGTTS